MKLHLPKRLFTALIAVISMAAAPIKGAPNELNVSTGGNFYAGNYAFSFQIDGNDLDATEDTTDVLALYWGTFSDSGLYTNGITLTHASNGITLYVGDGSRANAGADNDHAEITESTTFTGSRGATFTDKLDVGATYTLVNKGANGVQTVMLLKNGVCQETVTYNGNMHGGNENSTMYSVWNDDYAPGNVLVWNGTSNSSSFEISNFIGGNATLAESDLIFASGIDGVTTTVSVSGEIAAGSISIYDSYIFNASAATTLSTTEGLSIASDKTLTLQGQTITLSGSITNNGTLTASNVITLSGTVTNNGTLNLAGFTVAADTTASVTGTGTINLSGTITNEGTLNLAGFTVAAEATASITNGGTLNLAGFTVAAGAEAILEGSGTTNLSGTITNNGTLNLNGVLNISSLAGLEQSGEYSDVNNNGVFTGSFSVVTSGEGAVLKLDEASFGLQLNGSALDTSTNATTYYTYDSSKGFIKIFETGNQTYWINTNASYDASNTKMLNAESFTVAAGAEFYLTDASVLSKTLIPTDTSKVYFRAIGSETNLLRFTGASGGAGLSLTASKDATTQEVTVTTGNSASSYAGNIIVLEGTTLELGATRDVAVAGETYNADKNRFITVEDGATLDVKGNEAYYHVVLEDGAKLTNSGSDVDTGWKALPYVELQGDATIEASYQMVMQKGGNETSGTFQLALNEHKLTKTGDGTLYLKNVSIGSGTLQIDKGTVETAGGVTLVSGAALDVIINDGTLKTGPALSLRNLTLGAGADAVNVNSNTLTVTGNTHAAGTFTKSGDGTLKLQGATTFNGGVNVERGSLQVTGALTAGAITKTGTGTLELASGVGTQVLSGTNSIGAGNLKITTNDVIDYTNSTNTEINGATLTLDSRQTVDDSNTFTLTNGTIAGTGATYNNAYTAGLDIYQNTTVINSSGTSSISTGMGLRSSTSKAKFNVTEDTLTTSGVIAGAGGVVKTEAGELVLEGANTYTGGTSIDAGKLTVKHASALGTGGVEMTGGELNVAEGIGLVLGGALTAAADSTLTLNNGSSLTLGAASTIAGTVTGAGNIASNYNTTFSGAVSGWTGSFTNGAAMTLTFDGSANAVNAAITQTTGNLTLTVGTTADATFTFGGAVTANQINVNQNTTFNGAVTAANMKVAGSETVTFAGGTEHEITTINPGTNTGITYDVAAGASLKVLQNMWMTNSSITLKNEASFSHAGQALEVIGTGNGSSISRAADGESGMSVGNTGYTISNAEVNMSNSDAATLGMKLTQSSLTTKGIGKLTVSNSLNTITNLAAESGNVELSASMAVDSISAKEGKTVTVTGGNTIDMGGGTVSIGTNGTDTDATMTAKNGSALAQLQEDASFTIQDMTLTNTTITAATLTTQVKLQNVTANNVVLAQGKFSTDADMGVTVGMGGSGSSLVFEGGLAKNEIITINASEGASLAVDLGDLSCVTEMGPGKYDLSITLSGVKLDFYTDLEDGTGITFEGWLGELIGASSGVQVSFSEAPAAAAEGGAATGVTYSTGSVGTVIRITGLNVPEPASATLGLAALMMLCARRRRKA